MKEESSKAGLDMNVKKTKTISRDPEGKKVDIKVDNETLQQVEKFIYLGTLILEEIKTDKEIERRKNIAKEKFSSMAKILKSKRLKLATKLKIVKCYIYSIFTYGCEAWTLSKVLEAKIEAFEMWCLRELGNVMWKDKVTNESVLTKLKTKRQLLSDIQKRKLKYFGHIKRKKQYLDDSIRRKVRRQETKRVAVEQLDGGHQGVDLPASLRLHQPSCRPRPVECHCTSTVEEAMTLPDATLNIFVDKEPLTLHELSETTLSCKPSPFYGAQFGVEIFVELYNSTLSSPVSSYVLKRYITFYFIDLTIVVYFY